MNATVQYFSHIKRFRENSLDICKYSEHDEKDKYLSFALGEVFHNLWVELKHN